ncbi:AraC family transcriptional regulator [Actinomycetospora sp. NBRC 106375]|nr:AraC family transcriptional regulator [Actinomycetospora sp. NBRC 106375]
MVGSWPLAAGSWFPEHTHNAHQLNWAVGGVLGVRVGHRSWILPPTLALWLPAGVPHRTGATRDATLRSLFLSARLPDLGSGDPVPVAVDGLLLALAAHLERTDLAEDARTRAEGVVLDALRPLPTRPVAVPEPADPRCRAVADALHRDPSDDRGLAALAAAAGSSRRTVSRLFVQDTGLSFERWRRHLRVRAALPMLAEGRPVDAVARAVGYATPSAFLAAFRGVVGTSPSRYLGRRD